MKPVDVQAEERIFLLADFVRLVKRRKRTIFKAACLCALFFCGYALMQPACYKVTAVFKECADNSGKDVGLGTILGLVAGGGGESLQAEFLMKSNAVLKPLVQRLGLQIGEQPSTGRIARAFVRMRERIRAERGLPLDDVERVVFSDVAYEGEKPLFFSLRAVDAETYEIRLQGVEQRGRLGEPFELGPLFLKVVSAPSSAWRPYQASPWQAVCERLRGQVAITSKKLSKSIYDLSLKTRDRQTGVLILNGLMEEYRAQLKRQHDGIMEQQVAYLQERQREVQGQFAHTLEHHVDFLEESLREQGFWGVKGQENLLQGMYQTLARRVFDAELEAVQAEKALESKKTDPLFEQAPDAVRSRLAEWEQERDLLQASLGRKGLSEAEGDLSGWASDLNEVRRDRALASQALDLIETSPDGVHALDFVYDPSHAVCAWARAMGRAGGGSEDLALYLRTVIRHLGVREKILQERSIYDPREEDLAGIDLDTARALLVAASRDLDRAKAGAQSFRSCLEKLQDPAVEIGSLGVFLSDPLSQQLLANASALYLKIRDEEAHSARERERYEEQLRWERSMLAEHVQQLIGLERDREILLKEKIASLQQTCLDCLNRRISVAYEQAEETVSRRKEALLRQKQLAEEKMDVLRKAMAASLPRQWQMEQELALNAETSRQVMKSITELAESKSLTHRLHYIESRAWDPALPPSAPQKPYLCLGALFGALMGAGFSCAGLFLSALYRGLPASLQTLQALRYPAAGSLTFGVDGPDVEGIADEDLETLRKVVLRMEQGISKTAALYCSSGPDYSYTLASMLAQAGRKVLLVRTDFFRKFLPDGKAGLLDFLQGRVPEAPIRTGATYDILPTGGYTRFGAELFRSPRWSDLLQEAGRRYDHILCANRAPPVSAEAEALLASADLAAVTITSEPIHVLTPLVQWGYHEQRCRIIFLSSDS